MSITPIGDNDKLDLAEKITPVIQRHETNFLGAAFADASTQYGEWRQLGLDHSHAMWEIHNLLATPQWYSDTFPMDQPTPAVILPLGPLHTQVSSIFTGFMDEQNTPWIWKGMTDFLLYKRYLDGEDITPLLQERRSLGANTLRVLLMCHNIAHFYPQDYAEYYTKLPQFSQLLASYGLRWEAVAFADQQNVKVDEQAHWNQVGNTLRFQSNAFLELVNEFPQNGIDPSKFQHPAGMLCSHGSGLADSQPAIPFWDFVGWHGRRDMPKVTSSGEDLYYIQHGMVKEFYGDGPAVAIHDEPMGFAEVEVPGSRAASPILAKQIAATSAFLGAGGTFHCDDGIQSRLLRPNQMACAKAFFNGFQS